MLHEFIDLHRDAIIARTRDRVRSRPWPSVAPGEVEHGVPLFLTQLAETLRLEWTSARFPADAIGAAAACHGRGDIRIRNIPAKGCVFIIEMPLAADAGVPHEVG